MILQINTTTRLFQSVSFYSVPRVNKGYEN